MRVPLLDDVLNELIGEVLSMMYLGDNQQYSLRLADSALVRAVEYNPPMSKTKVGDRLALEFDAHCLDGRKENGRPFVYGNIRVGERHNEQE